MHLLELADTWKGLERIPTGVNRDSQAAPNERV